MDFLSYWLRDGQQRQRMSNRPTQKESDGYVWISMDTQTGLQKLMTSVKRNVERVIYLIQKYIRNLFNRFIYIPLPVATFFRRRVTKPDARAFSFASDFDFLAFHLGTHVSNPL